MTTIITLKSGKKLVLEDNTVLEIAVQCPVSKIKEGDLIVSAGRVISVQTGATR